MPAKTTQAFDIRFTRDLSFVKLVKRAQGRAIFEGEVHDDPWFEG
jgi:hypothetical protein